MIKSHSSCGSLGCIGVVLNRDFSLNPAILVAKVNVIFDLCWTVESSRVIVPISAVGHSTRLFRGDERSMIWCGNNWGDSDTSTYILMLQSLHASLEQHYEAIVYLLTQHNQIRNLESDSDVTVQTRSARKQRRGDMDMQWFLPMDAFLEEILQWGNHPYYPKASVLVFLCCSIAPIFPTHVYFINVCHSSIGPFQVLDGVT